MHSNGYRRASLGGILAVAAGFLVQPGHASNWCPTAVDNEITCSNCSRELTCDVNGISIEIHGSNVTLDGQGHSISNAPGNGVAVWYGVDNTIKDLYIYDSGSNGILFYGSMSANFSYVQNVYISGSVDDGIQHGGWYPVEIDNSFTYYNAIGVRGSSDGYTDFLSSSTSGNNIGYDANYANSYVIGSYFWNNSTAGVHSDVAGLLVNANSFSGSSGYGLYIDGGDYSSIVDNYGYSNTNGDCVVVNSSNTSASGNNWGSYTGSGCIF